MAFISTPQVASVITGDKVQSGTPSVLTTPLLSAPNLSSGGGGGAGSVGYG